MQDEKYQQDRQKMMLVHYLKSVGHIAYHDLKKVTGSETIVGVYENPNLSIHNYYVLDANLHVSFAFNYPGRVQVIKFSVGILDLLSYIFEKP